MIKKVALGDNVKVGACAVVDKSFIGSDMVVAGVPAVEKKHSPKNWIQEYDGEGNIWQFRYNRVLSLKEEMNV